MHGPGLPALTEAVLGGVQRDDIGSVRAAAKAGVELAERRAVLHSVLAAGVRGRAAATKWRARPSARPGRACGYDVG